MEQTDCLSYTRARDTLNWSERGDWIWNRLFASYSFFELSTRRTFSTLALSIQRGAESSLKKLIEESFFAHKIVNKQTFFSLNFVKGEGPRGFQKPQNFLLCTESYKKSFSFVTTRVY